MVAPPFFDGHFGGIYTKDAKIYRIFYIFLNVQNLIDDFAIFFYKKKQIVVDIAQGIV